MLKRIICWLLCLAAFCSAAGAETVYGSGAEGTLERFLADCAAEQENPWIIAVLKAGARSVSWQGNRADFFLRGFNPELKSLGSYTDAPDKQVWREQAASRLSAYDLQVSVTFGADGTVSAKEKKAFLKTVRAAAKKAKEAFGKKNFQRFLTDLLFRVPATGYNPKVSTLMTADPDFVRFIEADPETFPCESPTEWVPMLYLQKDWKYSFAGGPHEITVTWKGAEPEKLLSEAAERAQAIMKEQGGESGSRLKNLSYYWWSALAETALRMKKRKLPQMRLTFDLDEILNGGRPEDYRSYFARYNPKEAFRQLEESVAGTTEKNE